MPKETDPMPREDFACTHRLRVRWAEVDMRFGSDIILRKATVEYPGSGHYDDELEVLWPGAKRAEALPDNVRRRVLGFEKVAPAQ